MVAKDALGNDVKATQWLSTHKKGDRSLTQGLKVKQAAAADAPSLPYEHVGSCGKLRLLTLASRNLLAHTCWPITRFAALQVGPVLWPAPST